MEITLPSFAKINLGLRVLRKRRDGYHDLQTIFQTVDFCDHLTFSFSKENMFHVVLDVGESDIPADTANLIYKACHEFHQSHPIKARIEVRIHKRIPVGSGLGGGSSNAACTLLAVSRQFNSPIPPRRLKVLASQIGADVPFFLYGGTALGMGRGDKLKILDDLDTKEVLIVTPDVRCSTAEIYRKYDELRELTVKPKTIKIKNDLRPEFPKDLVSHPENDLERVVFALYPELDSIKKRLIESGAVIAGMTGSGSAVYGLFDSLADLEHAGREFPGAIRTRFLNRSEYRTRLGIVER